MDDLISREAALEVIEAVKNVSWSQSGKVLCSKMYSQIKDLPSAKAVNAAPVAHGRWIRQKGSAFVYKCSACGFVFAGAEIARYCPHCGAKMEGKHNK